MSGKNDSSEKVNCSFNRRVEFSLLESMSEQVVHNQFIWENGDKGDMFLLPSLYVYLDIRRHRYIDIDILQVKN